MTSVEVSHLLVNYYFERDADLSIESLVDPLRYLACMTVLLDDHGGEYFLYPKYHRVSVSSVSPVTETEL
jgi:hypothetical protein